MKTVADEPSVQKVEEPQRDPIRGKVASLLNERELVINIGERNGVQPRMRFRVLTANPIEVQDPDTGEPLGEIEREKVRVQAVEVHAHLAICATYETIRRGGAGVNLPDFSREAIVRTLRHDDRGHIPPISPQNSYVSIGDVVEEIIL